MEPTTTINDAIWTGWQKNAFRFFFLFLSITSIAGYNVIVGIFSLYESYWGKTISFLSSPVYWLDCHFYHFGYDPKQHSAYFADGYFGWASLVTIFFFSIAGTILWAILDKKRSNYNKLHFWFRTYLAYYLFLALNLYAFEKMIPSQMPYPNVDELLSPVGNQSRFRIVWNFIGSNTAYSIFTGVCELIAALLILFRRTRVFGCLFMTTVLINVVCLNFFYNIPVKISCSQLLLTTLFLLAPYVPRLWQFFYKLKPVSLAEKAYRFTTPWKNVLLFLLLLGPAWASFGSIKHSLFMNKRDKESRKNQKLYQVNVFVKNTDTLPPLLNDTLRWKRFALTAYRKDKEAIIYNMHDEGDYYNYDIDSIKRTITLHDNPDTNTWHIFHYNNPGPGLYELTGTWKKFPIHVEMKALNIDSMFYLTREKITWVQDY